MSTIQRPTFRLAKTSSSDGREFLGQFIPLHYHYNMLADENRVEAFQAAIHAVVRPEHKVVELGGGTGILSFFAAQRGARVWCVEHNPELVEASRDFLTLNQARSQVEVVHADAEDYLPSEPVDVLICEMLHVALLRERQVAVIESFKRRYQKRFGQRLPLFVPDASLLGVQPVAQAFNFLGYEAPVPVFQTPTVDQPRTRMLGSAEIYHTAVYNEPLPDRIRWNGKLTISSPGVLNALRFATKNLVAVLPSEGRAIEWLNQFLVMPLRDSMRVTPGDVVQVEFDYEPGGSLDSLADGLRAELATQAPQRAKVG